MAQLLMGSCKPSLATPLFLFLGTAAPAFGSHDPKEEPLRTGARAYAEHCASCHGADLQGQPDWQRSEPDGTLRAPPHDDSGHTWHHPDQLLVDYVTLGGAETLQRLGVTGVESGMPAFGDVLSEDEIEAVLDYIASHWSERARAYQAEVTRQAGGN
jgi:mono/diheme cytochrome c family protein